MTFWEACDKIIAVTCIETWKLYSKEQLNSRHFAHDFQNSLEGSSDFLKKFLVEAMCKIRNLHNLPGEGFG
jgi:hypothetical protein